MYMMEIKNNISEIFETKISKLVKDTKAFEIGTNNYKITAKIFKKVFPGRKAMIVTTPILWDIIGNKIFSCLNDAKIETDKYLIENNQFSASWQYVEMLEHVVKGDIDGAKIIEKDENYIEPSSYPQTSKEMKASSKENYILVAVGGGAINDLCKLSSYRNGDSYLTFPTAASVDGFASFGASITYHNSKQTFDCPAPAAIVADIDVICHAPKAVNIAGYADLAAKIPAGGEWIIANFLDIEPLNKEAWHLLHDSLADNLSNPEGISKGETDAIMKLFSGLTNSGLAMQIVNSSRPASGCEHLFSHILDTTKHTYNGRPISHGFQVAISTLFMSAIFDEFLKIDFTKLDVDKCVANWPSLEEEQKRALKLFKDYPAPQLGYEEITKKYEDKDTVRKQLEKLKANWPELKAKLEQNIYSYSKMKSLLKAANAPTDPSEIGISHKEIKEMLPIMQCMRSRFNILDLARRGMFFDKITEPLFAKGGVLEI